MAETWNKKEREKKKQQNKKDKAEKKQDRKDQNKGKSLDDMLAYVDEYGNLSETPPDLGRVRKVKLEDIEIGVPKQREQDPADLLRVGIITFFNQDKGYGFIKDSETKESIFVHINAIKEPVKENNKVSFEVEMGAKGPNAVNVQLVQEPK